MSLSVKHICFTLTYHYYDGQFLIQWSKSTEKKITVYYRRVFYMENSKWLEYVSTTIANYSSMPSLGFNLYGMTAFSPANIHIKNIPHHIICITYQTPLLQMKKEMWTSLWYSSLRKQNLWKKECLCEIKPPVLACIKIYHFFSIRNYFLMNVHKCYPI